MIKKMMMEVSSNKEAVSKKALSENHENSSAKKMFGILLQSIQKSASNGDLLPTKRISENEKIIEADEDNSQDGNEGNSDVILQSLPKKIKSTFPKTSEGKSKNAQARITDNPQSIDGEKNSKTVIDENQLDLKSISDDKVAKKGMANSLKLSNSENVIEEKKSLSSSLPIDGEITESSDIRQEKVQVEPEKAESHSKLSKTIFGGKFILTNYSDDSDILQKELGRSTFLKEGKEKEKVHPILRLQEATSKNEFSNEQKKLLNHLITKGNTPSSSEKSIGIKNIMTEHSRKEEPKRLPSFGNREENPSSDGRIFTNSDRSPLKSGKQRAFLQPGLPNLSGNTSKKPDLNVKDQQMEWNQHVTESSVEVEDGKGVENRGSARMKLSQMPVSNISLRKKILPGLTQKVLNAAGNAKENSQNWQKHSFVLEDGKKIHLSARQGDGVLHLKLGSLQGELNKLLQQHQQEIREHLEQECGTEIDLQFENQEEQQMSEFLDDSRSPGEGQTRKRQLADDMLSSKKVENVLIRSVRSFGYNQMEWTA